VSHVFLSYSREDRPVVERLTHDLTAAGVSVWSDLALLPGDDWLSQISGALDEATAVVVIVSPASLASAWVTREWAGALERSQRVFPVLAGGATFADLPEPLASVQAVDLESGYDRAVEQIAAAAKALEKSAAPPVSAEVDLAKVSDAVYGRVMERLGMDKSLPGLAEDPQDETLVFVITSYEPDMEPVFEAIKSAAEAVNLRAERVKDVKGDYRITDKMLAAIRRARFVVADLTHERPNVYFELGYARGLGKTVVTIMRAETTVHFDVQDWPYIDYIDSRPLERDLLDRFRYELSAVVVERG
jgi:hypothetical protein